MLSNFYNTTDISLFESGTINGQTGTNTSNAKRIRTIDYLIDNIHGIVISNGYFAYVYAYSGNTYQGFWDGNSFSTISGTSVRLTGTVSLKALNPDYSYRIVVGRDDNGDISVSEANNIVLLCYVDETLSRNGVPADAKKVGAVTKKINDRMLSLEEEVTGTRTILKVRFK